MFKFYIKVFGCTMRGIEAEKLNAYFVANQCVSVSIEVADIICVFGCSIIYATDNTTLKYLKEITENYPKKKIIVLGCSPELSGHKIRNFFKGDMIATKSLENIDVLFPDFIISFNSITLPTVSHASLDYNEKYLKEFKVHQSRYFYKKKDTPQIIITGKGCSNSCSYCAVRNALGSLKSYNHSDIVDIYKSALEKNNNVIIFNGDDTGAYGTDKETDFEKLLTDLDSITPQDKNIKWVIDNLHPQWLIKYKETFYMLVSKGRIVEIILPLQAATDTMLKRMRRKHLIGEVVPILINLKEISKKIKLSTHFIIGFPGETMDDLNALKELIDKGFFSHINLLRYYESGDAHSHTLYPKIDNETTQKHMIMLREFILERNIYCQMTDFE